MTRFALIAFGTVLAAPSLILAVVVGLLLAADPTHCAPSNWPVC
jgi:hypothetical protein